MSGAREQVARLLELLPYLQSHRDLSLAQVAADFGVTADRIRDDLRVLYLCGLPDLMPDTMIDIDFEAFEDDPDGIVRIDNADFLTRPVRLGSSEASALIVALRTLRESGTTASAEVIDRALAKLEGAIAVGAELPAVEVHAPGDEHTAAVARTLRDAIDGDRQVRLDYYVPSRDEVTERVVDPLDVQTSEGRDYLDAWCHLAGGRRTFRLDRVHGAVVLQEPRSRPDLTPRDLTSELFEPGPDDLEAELEVEPGARWIADYHPVSEVHELGEGRLSIRMRVSDPRWLVRLVLGSAPHVRVRSPESVRAEVDAALAATLGLYDSP